MRTKTAILSIADLKTEDLPRVRAALQAVPGVGKIDFSIERSVAVLELIRVNRTLTIFYGQSYRRDSRFSNSSRGSKMEDRGSRSPSSILDLPSSSILIAGYGHLGNLHGR